MFRARHQHDPILKRCPECRTVHLVAEPHSCMRLDPAELPLHLRLEDVVRAFEIGGSPITPEEICRIINKMYGRQKYTHFEVTHVMEGHPKLFRRDQSRPRRFRCGKEVGHRYWERPDWQLPQEDD